MTRQPPSPALTALRRARGLLRAVAALVTLTFTLGVLSPSAAAAREAIERERQFEAKAPSDEAELSRTLQKIEARLAHFAERLAQRQDSAEDAQDLDRLRRQVERLDAKVRAGFERVEQDLEAKGLPQVILERHRAAVQTYQSDVSALLGNLDAVERAPDAQARGERLRAARAHLGAKQHRRPQQPFDPEHLPAYSLKPNPDNQPRTDPAQFKRSRLFDTPYARLAALGDFRLDRLPGAEDPAFLAESDEVVLTQAIRDKAAELGNDPVRIYHWVRNQVTWLPTWGAIQDAEVTLDTRRGNAMDIASLAIALLRASGIPARYVHGTIDVPQAQFRNWIGGVADAGAAADFAASGGVPITSLVAGGQVAMLRLEHVWLEAAIDFEPSRGARNRAADTWAPLDPSFKQYLHTPALDLPALVPLDGDAILQRALTGARIDDTLGSLTGVDADAIQGAIQDYAGRVAAYLDAHPEIGGAPALTGRRTIIEQAAPMLPSSLPYQVVTEGVRWDRIPARLQHSLTLELPTAGQVRLPLARLGTRRLAIAYEPATPDDAAALDDAIASGAGALPLYLVEVKPVVRLDETPLAQGGAVAMGSDQRIDLTLSSPLGQNRLSYLRVAGDVLAVGIDPAGIDGATVARRLTAVPLATAAENLHQIALHYWQQGDLLADLAATVLGVIVQRLPSVGLFASPLEVTYNFGIPRSGHNIGRNIDIKHSVHAVYHQDPERQRAFVDLAGTIMSYLEGSILEQLMPHWQGTALSAIQSLLDANAQGIPIYRIDAANAGAILPRLGFSDAAVRQDIDTALRAGQEAIVPERIPAKPIGAQGLGLILRDPVTGAAAYRIFGGLDGGTLEPPCAEPQPQPLALSLRDQILTETVLTIVALAVAEAASGGAGAMVNSGV